MAEYQRKDHLYNKAKEEGYRSRAAYKLLEIQKKHRLIRSGQVILDLGCYPGGWCQVAAQLGARVVGVDIRTLETFADNTISIVEGDANDPDVQAELLRLAGRKFDLVLSDMSPHLSGIEARDNVRIAELVELAFDIAFQMLRPNGIVVAKAFPCNDVEEVLQRQKKRFQKLKRTRLESTRTTSNELYVTAMLPGGAK